MVKHSPAFEGIGFVARSVLEAGMQLARALGVEQGRLLDQRLVLATDAQFAPALGVLLESLGAGPVMLATLHEEHLRKVDGDRVANEAVLAWLSSHAAPIRGVRRSRWREGLGVVAPAGEELNADRIVAVSDATPPLDALIAFAEKWAKSLAPGGICEWLVRNSHQPLQLLAGPAENFSPATRRHLATLGLSSTVVEPCEGQPYQRVACWRKLAAAPIEYPDTAVHDRTLLAHCRARLEFAGQFVTDREVLEIGSGAGLGAQLFCAAGARRVVGVDRLPSALHLARANSPDPNVAFVLADLDFEPLPTPSSAFDVVVCLEVLEHLARPNFVLAELRRALRPNGTLILSIPDADFEADWATRNGYENPFHVGAPRRGDLADFLREFPFVTWYCQASRSVSTVAHPDALGATSLAVDPQGATRPMAWLVVASFQPFEATPVAVEEGDSFVPLADLRDQSNQQAAARTAERSQYRAEILRRDEAYVQLVAQNAATLASRNHLLLDIEEDQKTMRRIDERRQAVQLAPVVEWVKSGAPAFFPGEPPLADLDALLALALHATTFDSCSKSLPWLSELHWVGDQLTVRGCRAVPQEIPALLFPRPWSAVSARQLLSWRRRACVHDFWFLEADRSWRRIDADTALVRKWRVLALADRLDGLLGGERRLAERITVRLLRRRRRLGPAEMVFPPRPRDPMQTWESFVVGDNARPSVALGYRSDHPLAIVQYVGALYAGGAERQMVNLALRQSKAEASVCVRTTCDLKDDRGHHLLQLSNANIDVRQAGPAPSLPPERQRLITEAPSEIAGPVAALAAELRQLRPDVLHCWLDQPNLIGGLAGLLADVPTIVLSTRNHAPTCFPRLLGSYMKAWYQLLAKSKRVRWIANSRSGAQSYASWLEIPLETFQVIRNGIAADALGEMGPQRRSESRRRLGLLSRTPIVAGAFRLDAEKRPELFLDTVADVVRQVPETTVLLAGDGPLRDRVQKQIDRLGLTERVRCLGRMANASDVLAAADVVLLTSTYEGCPNVLAEAQCLGTPVVTARAGGAVEYVRDGVTGILADDHPESLAKGVIELLTNRQRWRAMAIEAQSYARSEFDLDEMVIATRQVYLLSNSTMQPMPDATFQQAAA